MLEILVVIAIFILIICALIFLRINKINSGNELKEISNIMSGFEKNFAALDSATKDEFARNREEFNRSGKDGREELSTAFKRFGDLMIDRIGSVASRQKEQLDIFSEQLQTLTKSNEERLEKMRLTVEGKLTSLQEDNNQKLEKMRQTVDEKLHETLERRLGESFQIVSDRLEKVQEGLGEMKDLATGVGDLKKVLSNVKTRGMIGEYQLKNILEQILTPEQYGENVKTSSDGEGFVEFAVKLPGRSDPDKPVWLPIDSKFPIENYHALNDAYDVGDVDQISKVKKKLTDSIKLFAKDIRDKYIDPPNTTDFAIMFLPVEGLYAEILREPSVFEILQKEYKIIITGPTTLSALLNSLQMGFRTLAIEKRSSEVWEILGAVKTEFGKFGDILDKTQKKLQETSNVINQAGVRSRAIERKLKDVQSLPADKSAGLLDDNFDMEFEE